jgi:hypothetical protein
MPLPATQESATNEPGDPDDGLGDRPTCELDLVGHSIENVLSLALLAISVSGRSRFDSAD